MKRFIIPFLALLLIFVMTACGTTPPETPPAVTTAPVETTNPPETKAPVPDLVIVEGETMHYRIVRDGKCSKGVHEQALSVGDLIASKTGVSSIQATDVLPEGAEYDHNTLEILIGRTQYSESAEALEKIPYGDFVITVVGNKIVVTAYSDTAIVAGLRELKTLIRQNADTGTFTLPGDLFVTGTHVEVLNALPHYAEKEKSLTYHVGEKNYLLLVEDTTADAYRAYLEKLEKNGFSFYTDNQIGDNLFAIYRKDGCLVTAGYAPAYSTARFVVAEDSALPGVEADNRYEKVLSAPTLAQLGLEAGAKQNGMSYVIQLIDGSYVIIDGGFNRSRDVKQLYDYMYNNAPDKENIVIAAWFITHSHGDHVGALVAFAKSEYTSKVKVEKIIAAFASDEALTSLVDAELAKASTVKAAVDKFDGVSYVRAHAGQKFYLRDAEIEVLYTVESFFPELLQRSNATSLVLSMQLAGQKVLFLGDATNQALDIVHTMYGDYIKCDFLQAAHHGYHCGDSGTRGIISAYTTAAPDVVLWPIGQTDYKTVTTQYAYSNLLANRLKSVKEIIVAGNRDIVLTLPYTVGTSGFDTILK